MHVLKFIGVALAFLLTACGGAESEKPSTEPNTKQTSVALAKVAISEDTAKLAQVLDLKKYPPERAVFKWNGKDKEGLEALLVYDEKTFGDILTAYMDAGFPKGNYSRDQFNFQWLDSARVEELNFSKPDYVGNPDIFLGTDGKGMLWFLDKKLLLKVAP